MDYNTLVSGLLALNRNDVQGLQRLGQILTDLSDSSTMELLQNIRDLEIMISNVNQLNNAAVTPPDTMTQRARFLNRAERLSESEGITLFPQGTQATEPYFSQFDLIYCHFGGVGSEYDGPHYALVWEDYHNSPDITVVPTTSQYTKEFADEFSIGRVSGLPPYDTVLSVKKLMRISRKRVIPHRTGRYIRGHLHNRLHAFYRERILNAIAIWLFGEIPLDYYVRNEINVALPVDFLTHYPEMRFWPVRDVRWDRTNNQLQYRKWTESNLRSLQLKNPNVLTRKAHKIHAIYDKIFSNNQQKIQNAITEFNQLYV
jgi:hypothetical protein